MLIASLATMMIATRQNTFTAAAATAYTEYKGTLEGADYTIRIPSPIESWNGNLEVFCRGYLHDKNPDPMSTGSSSNEGWSQAAIARGAAFAVSNYGSGGYCIRAGMNVTYQLTQYVRSTFNATGKVYVVGVSMGGCIALMLGEKYPNVYSGVLDVCGLKNLTASYDGAIFISTANDAEMDARLQELTAPIPPYPFSLYGSIWRAAYRSFCSQAAADMVAEFGGTPSAVPQAYQDTDPLYHANISIPVITVHGTSDALVPYARTLQYQTAVTAAGKSSLYRLYPVAGGEHASTNVLVEAADRLNELIAWAATIPEGLTIGAMLMLSTIAVIVSMRYFRKQPRTRNCNQIKL